MVTFTKDLSSANRKVGLWLLGYYWRDSVISKSPYYPLTNFAGMISFLDKNYPTYIESLGEMSKTVTSDKLIQAMKDAAARKLTDYPRPAYFNLAIIGNTGVSVGSIVADTASEIGDELVMGSRVILFLMVAVGLGIGYLYLKPFLPKGK